MENEKLRILKMVQEGKLSADEASELLEALDLNEEQTDDFDSRQSAESGTATVLHVEISDRYSGEVVRDLKFPLSIARKLTGIIPPSLLRSMDVDLPGGLDLKKIIREIDSPWPAVLYDRDEKDQHIRIYTD